MTEEHPYRAEYAKSGRSSCKGCKNKIDKDCLRLAIMVQSPSFDAKIPNWYHVSCFFKRKTARNVSPADIGHLDSLKWADQENVKSQCVGSSSASSNANKSDEFNDFLIEYAKSGKSTCRSCANLIPKGEVRTGVTEYEGENAAKFGPYKQWFHTDCFVKERFDFNFFESADKLPGFAALSAEDKVLMKKKIKVDKKRKAEAAANVKEKVQKVESQTDAKEQKKLKAESDLIFKHRNMMKDLSKQELKSLLEHNNQGIPAGESAMLDALSDIMTFGALVPCSECKNGQLKYSNGHYRCTGNMSEWTKCQAKTRDPKRVAFKVPADLKEEHNFLAKYKYKKKQRLLPKENTTNSNEEPMDTQPTKIKEKERKPLENVKIAIVGKLIKTRTELRKEIENLGGQITTTIDGSVLAVISSGKELRKYSQKIREAEENNVHVVSEEFLDRVKNGGAALMVCQCSLSTWGSDPNERMSFSYAQRKQMKEESAFTKSAPSTMTMKIKGGACVEPDSGLEDIAHVYVERGAVHSVVLGMVDVSRGTNSYYKLQLLENDKNSSYWIYRAWGRLGTTIGGSKLEPVHNKSLGLQDFCFWFEDKTGNSWDDRNNFEKVPGKFFPMEIDFGQNDEQIKKLDVKQSKSKLAKAIQDLVCLIFDVESMKKALVEYEIDLKKMPLGKISKRQIESAYKVLTKVLNVIKDGSNANMLLDASNKFYTLIPHDFGMKKPPLLDSEEIIKKKIEMLNSLLDIEIAYNMLKGAQEDKSKDPVDVHYEKLKTDISVVNKSSNEFKMIKTYVSHTHAATHNSYDLEVLEAFKIDRHGEAERYSKSYQSLNNKKLLWHGSRVTNYGGILSEGLRIAPPEAPSTGYMFGKGIYFADMVSKSANYCWTSPSDPHGLMLLCEVALGNMYERDHADYITKLPNGMHSTKGCGTYIPDPKHTTTLENDIEVPYGKQVDTSRQGSLLYNEYIVYNTSQVKMKYLLKMNFKYKYQW